MNCSGYFKQQRKLNLFLLAFLLLLLLLSMVRCAYGPVFYSNTTDSAPRGLYLVVPWQTMEYGDYVIAALPEDVPALHVEQGFLLLKQVQGLPGDIYTVYSNALAIRDESYVIHHLPGLPQLETGRQVIPEDEVLLLNPVGISFDSRYLGPIGMQQIKCRVILILPYAVLDELKERLVKINETR